MNTIVSFLKKKIKTKIKSKMRLINILLVLLIFLFLSDLFIKNSPKSKLNLVPINYKIKKKDGLNELIIDLKIINKSKTKETMVSNINFELDFFKNKGNEYYQNFNYQEDIYIYENNKIKNLNNYWPTTIIKSNSELFVRIIYKSVSYTHLTLPTSFLV